MTPPIVTTEPLGLKGRSAIDCTVRPLMLLFLTPTALDAKDNLIAYGYNCNHNQVLPNVTREITNNALNNPLRLSKPTHKNDNGRDMTLVASYYDRVSVVVPLSLSYADYYRDLTLHC